MTTEIDELDRILNYYGMRCAYEALGEVPADSELLTKPQAKAAIQAWALNGRRQVLNDLLEWAELWSQTHKEPFNYHGAIKAMLVMKEPQKPFVVLRDRIKGTNHG